MAVLEELEVQLVFKGRCGAVDEQVADRWIDFACEWFR